MRLLANSRSTSWFSGTRPPSQKCALCTVLVSKIAPSSFRLSFIAWRLVSTKYQLNAEIVTTRMRLKKATNFVRRLMNLRPAGAGDKGDSGGVCDIGLFISASIRFVNEAVEFFRERNAQEPRGIEIHGDLHPLNWYRSEWQYPLSIKNAFGEYTGFAADLAIVDGEAQ